MRLGYMVFSKKELEENYPLIERMRMERAKTQSSITFWINELVSSHFPGIEDVPALLAMTQSLVSQVEGLYEEKQALLAAFPGTKTTEDVIDLAKGMEEQLKAIYAEKENK